MCFVTCQNLSCVARNIFASFWGDALHFLGRRNTLANSIVICVASAILRRVLWLVLCKSHCQKGPNSMAGVAFCEMCQNWQRPRARHRFEVAIFHVLMKTRRKTSILKLQSVKIGGSLARNARFEAPTCLVSMLWSSSAVAVSMGEAANHFLVKSVKASSNVVLRGRRGTFWQSHVSGNVTKHILRCRRNACAYRHVNTCHYTSLYFNTLHSLHTPHTLHFTLCTPHFTLYNLHSTLYTPNSRHPTSHFALNTLHMTLDTLHSTLYTPHFTCPSPTLHSTPYTPHSRLHSTLHVLHFTLQIFMLKLKPGGGRGWQGRMGPMWPASVFPGNPAVFWLLMFFVSCFIERALFNWKKHCFIGQSLLQKRALLHGMGMVS